MSPEPYYERDGITIYHGDCREIVPALEVVDFVLTDPPYGMGWDTDSTRFSSSWDPVKRRNGAGVGRSWARVHGDDKPFDPTPLLDFERVVMWGSNHYASRLPPGTTLIWIKRNDDAFGSFLSDAEVAWRKGGQGVYCRRILFPPPTKRGEGGAVHPTQKPVALMRWCIEREGASVRSILDPFMGSGTTLVAAKLEGRKAIGIEIEERYCEIAAKRLAQGVLNFEEAL